MEQGFQGLIRVPPGAAGGKSAAFFTGFCSLGFVSDSWALFIGFWTLGYSQKNVSLLRSLGSKSSFNCKTTPHSLGTLPGLSVSGAIYKAPEPRPAAIGTRFRGLCGPTLWAYGYQLYQLSSWKAKAKILTKTSSSQVLPTQKSSRFSYEVFLTWAGLEDSFALPWDPYVNRLIIPVRRPIWTPTPSCGAHAPVPHVHSAHFQKHTSATGRLPEDFQWNALVSKRYLMFKHKQNENNLKKKSTSASPRKPETKNKS